MPAGKSNLYAYQCILVIIIGCEKMDKKVSEILYFGNPNIDREHPIDKKSGKALIMDIKLDKPYLDYINKAQLDLLFKEYPWEKTYINRLVAI